jgi:hypothetical protein
LAISRVIGTRREPANGCGAMSSGLPFQCSSRSRASGLENVQTFLGSRFSGQSIAAQVALQRTRPAIIGECGLSNPSDRIAA